MIDKKKLHFFRLCIIFGIITIFALLNEWSKPQSWQANNSMMSGSMGSMMSSMHLSNITLDDLIVQKEAQEAPVNAGSNDSTSSHHNAKDSELGRAHYFTTLSIVVLLPFIVAGTMFLAIVWLK